MTAGSRRAIAIVLAIALAANLAVIVASPGYKPSYDAKDYAQHAASIAAGDGYPNSRITAAPSPSAFRPPLYPYLLGGVFSLTGNSYTAGRVVNALLDVAIVLLVYLIAQELWGGRRALAAAALAAVAPPFFLLAAGLNTEPLFLALALVAVLLAVRFRRRGGLGLAAGAGLACGLATLTRANGILLVLPIALGVWTRRPRFSRGTLAAPLLVCAVALLSAAPWAVRNTLAFDRPVGFNGQTGTGLAGIYNEVAQDYEGYRATWVVPFAAPRYRPLYERRGLDEARLDSRLREEALAWARDHPGYVVESTVLNGLRIVQLARDHPALEAGNRRQLGLGLTAQRVEQWTFYLLALLALCGIFYMRRLPREQRIPGFVWLVPLLMLAAAAPIIGSTRYRIPSYPFLALAAAPVLVAGLDRLRSARRARTAA